MSIKGVRPKRPAWTIHRTTAPPPHNVTSHTQNRHQAIWLILSCCPNACTIRSMAPKRAVGSKDGGLGAAPTTAKKRKKPVSPPVPIPEKKPVGSALRAKPRRADFLQDVAAASGLEVAVVQTTLDAIQVVVGRQIREKTYSRIPNMVQMRLKIVPAREACTRLAFGKEVQVKPREQMKKVLVSALKPLNEALVG